MKILSVVICLSNLDEMTQTIYYNFLVNQYGWRREGELIHPTQDDIRLALLRMARELLDADEADHSLIETGRMLIKRDDTKLDVWLWVGELNADSI